MPEVAEEHDSVTSLIAAVEAGRGVALATESLRCLTGPRLKLLPIKPASQPLIMGILYLNPLSDTAKAFVSVVKQAVHP